MAADHPHRRPSPIEQGDALLAFLSAIGGDGREPDGGLIEFRCKPLTGRAGMSQDFVPITDPGRAARIAIRVASTHDVFVGAVPRREPNGSGGALMNAWLCWVDLDRDDAAGRLLAADIPLPSIAIRSGTGQRMHAHWKLQTPLRPSQVVDANRRLAQHLGADLASTDATRIVRVPSTWNHKHAPATPVTCVHLTDARYTVEELLAGVPELPASAPRPRNRPGPARDHDDPLKRIPADIYLPALTGREMNRERKIQCPWHANGQERTPSLHCFPHSRDWYCFACDRGGDVYIAGALLWGLDHRRDFHELRDRLARELLPAAQVAA